MTAAMCGRVRKVGLGLENLIKTQLFSLVFHCVFVL